MKRIIDGILYDTDKATKMAEGLIDKRCLYRSPRGRWFFVEEGRKFIPVSRAEALKWLERGDVPISPDSVRDWFPDLVQEA